MGAVMMNNFDPKDARRYFEHALELDATCVEALGGLTALDAAAKRFDEARARLDAHLARAPQNAAILLIAAKYAMFRGDHAQTESLLKRLIGADPGGLDGY